MLPELNFGFFTMSTFSLMIALACIAFLIMSVITLEKIEKFDSYTEKKVVIVSFVGIAAMAIFSVFFDSLFHSIEEGRLLIGGITYLGGIVGAFPITIYVFHKYCPELKESPFYYLGILLPGLVLAHAIGRIGCFCAGCCYGAVTDSVFGISFPAGSDAASTYPGGPNGGSLPVYPTQLFEALFEFLVFLVMIIFNKKLKKHYVEFYLITYSVFRFFLEFLRGDDRGVTGFSISPSQVMSIICIIGAIFIILYKKKIILKNYSDKWDKIREENAKKHEEAMKEEQSKPKKKRMFNTFETLIMFALVAITALFSYADITFTGSEKVNTLLNSTIPLITGIIAVGWILLRDEKVFVKPKNIYCFLIALVIAINNFPFISYFTGKSVINNYSAGVWILFLIYCLSVGAFEEFLFRGILLKYVASYFKRDKVGIIKTFFISSVVFGLAHLLNLLSGASFGWTITQVGFSILVGGLCAFVLIKTNNIILCALTHGLFNFCGLLVTETGLGNGVVFDVGTTIMMGAVGLVVGIYVLRSVFKLNDKDVEDFYIALDMPIKKQDNNTENAVND